MSGMLELAERCEKATGPNLRLAREIAGKFGWWWAPNKGPTRDIRPVVWVAPRDGSCHDDYPDFTASPDAAMTLVPEGWRKRATDMDDGDCFFGVEVDDDTPEISARARTWPLAICAAALRALTHQTAEERE